MFSKGFGIRVLNPLPDDKIQILPNRTTLQTTISNLGKKGRKLSKPVENTVGKKEIACYEQFLLFPQCFQKACFPGASKGVIVWECVKHWLFCLRFPTIFLFFLGSNQISDLRL